MVGGTLHRTFSSNSHLPFSTAGDCEINVKNCLGNTPKNLLGGESHLLQRTQEDKRVILPQDLYYGWRPQSWRCWGKMQKIVEELEDKLKEVMGEPSTEPFGTPLDLPQKTREIPKLAQPSTLVKPLWNLPQKLLAAQDGSAPENHRESESNSAPKPLLWLTTPKLLLLGKNLDFRQPLNSLKLVTNLTLRSSVISLDGQSHF